MPHNPETYERLMLKQLDGLATQEEAEALKAWLAASPDHRQQYEQAKRVWQMTVKAPDIPTPNKAEAWKQVATKARLRQAADRPAARKQQRIPQLHRAWIALPIIMAIGTAILWVIMTRPPSMVELAAQPGEILTYFLPDSSVVRLHSGSSLRYAETFNHQNRVVRLDGEAYFDVRTTNHPFLVQSQDANIQVLGTAFSVRSRNAATEVVVSEGRVRVTANQVTDQSVELGPGEGVRVASNQINALDTGILNEADAWINSSITFDATPFPLAIQEIARIWGIPITITSPALDNETVTGSIRIEQMQSTLLSLCLTLENSCSVREEDGSYIIF